MNGQKVCITQGFHLIFDTLIKSGCMKTNLYLFCIGKLKGYKKITIILYMRTYVTRSDKMRRKSRFGVLELLSDPESPQNYL